MVAGGVGEMICNLCGIGDSEAVCYAHMLGESMQMTNILRDVGEDLRMGRVYLPQVDLPIEKVDLLYLLHRAENDLWGVHDNGYKAETLFKEFMKEYIEMTRKSYANATKGLKYLPNSVARPIRIASDMYEGILKKIEENDFNVFTKRAYIRKRERIGIIFNRVISNPVS
jgi:phytoene synthase